MRHIAGLALSLALAAAAPLHADQFLVMNNVCSTGSFVVCASVSVHLTNLPGGFQHFTMSIANLEGQTPGTTPGATISSFGVTSNVPVDNPTVLNNLSSSGLTPTGGTSTVGFPENSADVILMNTGFDYNLFNGQIAGCTPPPLGTTLTSGLTLDGYFQTCGAGQTVVFDFTPDEQTAWDLRKMDIGLGIQGLNGQSAGIGCSMGSCPVTGSVTVTPEPRSIALVGSGLLLFGLVGYRRSS
jgi:hypothetical protein